MSKQSEDCKLSCILFLGFRDVNRCSEELIAQSAAHNISVSRLATNEVIVLFYNDIPRSISKKKDKIADTCQTTSCGPLIASVLAYSDLTAAFQMSTTSTHLSNIPTCARKR
jgi:hypothetical protein